MIFIAETPQIIRANK